MENARHEVKKVIFLLKHLRPGPQQMLRRHLAVEPDVAAVQDVVDEPPVHEEDDKPMEDWLEAEGDSPEEMLERSLYDKALNSDLPKAIEQLDERSRKIIQARWLYDETTGKGATLDDMSKELGISKERVRQIEKKAFSKLKEILNSEKDNV